MLSYADRQAGKGGGGGRMARISDLIKPIHRTPLIVIAVTMAAILLFGAVSWHNYGRLRDEQVRDAESDADRTLVAINDHNHAPDRLRR